MQPADDVGRAVEQQLGRVHGRQHQVRDLDLAQARQAVAQQVGEEVADVEDPAASVAGEHRGGRVREARADAEQLEVRAPLVEGRPRPARARRGCSASQLAEVRLTSLKPLPVALSSTGQVSKDPRSLPRPLRLLDAARASSRSPKLLPHARPRAPFLRPVTLVSAGRRDVSIALLPAGAPATKRPARRPTSTSTQHDAASDPVLDQPPQTASPSASAQFLARPQLARPFDDVLSPPKLPSRPLRSSRPSSSPSSCSATAHDARPRRPAPPAVARRRLGSDQAPLVDLAACLAVRQASDQCVPSFLRPSAYDASVPPRLTDRLPALFGSDQSATATPSSATGATATSASSAPTTAVSLPPTSPWPGRTALGGATLAQAPRSSQAVTGRQSRLRETLRAACRSAPAAGSPREGRGAVDCFCGGRGFCTGDRAAGRAAGASASLSGGRARADEASRTTWPGTDPVACRPPLALPNQMRSVRPTSPPIRTTTSRRSLCVPALAHPLWALLVLRSAAC